MLFFISLFSACYKKQILEYEDENEFIVEPASTGRALRIVGYLNLSEDKNIINIPPLIKGLPVTEIGPDSMGDFYFFKVTIPDTVINIMDFSLSGNYINDVTIPKSVREIGNGAFMNNRLTKITIPNSVRKIGYRAFHLNPLIEITIGKDVILEMLSGYDTVLKEEWKYTAFEGLEFEEVYEGNGREAGTYIFKDGSWQLE